MLQTIIAVQMQQGLASFRGHMCNLLAPVACAT